MKQQRPRPAFIFMDRLLQARYEQQMGKIISSWHRVCLPVSPAFVHSVVTPVQAGWAAVTNATNVSYWRGFDGDEESDISTPQGKLLKLGCPANWAGLAASPSSAGTGYPGSEMSGAVTTVDGFAPKGLLGARRIGAFKGKE